MKLRNSPNKKLIKAVNRFQPWSYGFLLEIEYEALKELYKVLVDVPRLRLAIKLLEIILEKDRALYIENVNKTHMTKYVNVKNWTRFFPLMKNLEEPCLQDTLRMEKAWHLYHAIRDREMREWIF